MGSDFPAAEVGVNDACLVDRPTATNWTLGNLGPNGDTNDVHYTWEP